MFSLKSTLEVL